MATGIEIAGLILGGIPVLISAIDLWMDGAENVKKGMHYKREIAAIRRELKVEGTIFHDICEKLWIGIVSPDQIDKIVKQPGCWHDPDAEESLKKRMGRSYEVYQGCVEDIKSEIDNFAIDLGLKLLEQPHTLSTIKANWDRAKFTFTHSKYQDALERMRTKNERLLILTDQNLELEPLRRRFDGVLKRFNSSRKRASELYDSINSHLTCGCSNHHAVSFLLGALPKVDTNSPDYYVHPNHRATDPVYTLLFSKTAADPISWTREEMELRRIMLDGTEQSETDRQDTNLVKDTVNEDSKDTDKRKKFLKRFKAAFTDASSSKSLSKSAVKFADSKIHKSASQTPMTAYLEACSFKSMERVEDLCSAFGKYRSTLASIPQNSAAQPTERNPCIGYIELNQNEGVGIYPLQNPVYRRLASGVRTFNSVLDPTVQSTSTTAPEDPKITLNSRKRYFLASVLASSVLELYNTPWLSQTFAAEDIYIAEDATSPNGTSVAVSKTFPAIEPSPLKELEPGFSMLRNPTIFALGIFLIEVCMGRPLLDFRTPEDPLNNGQANFITNWSIASRMKFKVIEEAGSRYWNVVQRCIWSDFDQSDNSFESDGFKHAFYEGAVEPLHAIFEEYRKA